MSFRIKLGIAFASILILTMLAAFANWWGMDNAVKRQQNLYNLSSNLEKEFYQLNIEEKAYKKNSGIEHSRKVSQLIDHIKGHIYNMKALSTKEKHSALMRDVLDALHNYETSFNEFTRNDIDMRTFQSRMLRESRRLLENTRSLQTDNPKINSAYTLVNDAILSQKDYMYGGETTGREVSAKTGEIIRWANDTETRSSNQSIKLKAFRILKAADIFDSVFKKFVAVRKLQSRSDINMYKSLYVFENKMKEFIDNETSASSRRIQTIRFASLLLTLLVIFSGIAATFILSRIITQPIKQLKSSAQHILDGKLSTSVDIKSRDEIGELGNIFNRMSVKLKDSFATLEEKNRSLMQSESKYKTLFDSNRDAIVTAGKDTVIISANEAAAEIFGYSSPEEMTGMKISEFLIFPQFDWPNFYIFMQEIITKVSEQGKVSMECLHKKKDNSIFTASCLITQTEINNQTVLLGTLRDITQKKKNEEELERYRKHLEDLVQQKNKDLEHINEQLRQSEKMQAIGQLAGGVAHDFNNQLAGIMGCAEILTERLEDKDEKSFKFASQIIKAGDRASGLVGQLLAFARKGNYLTIAVDIHDTIISMVNLLRHSIDKNIMISQSLNSEEKLITGDPSQIQSAILNIALNSCDAMPEGGNLTITTENFTVTENTAEENESDIKGGDYIKISISDNGCGMDEETQKHIFEPFFTTKEVGKGTGMGLSAVYGTVHSHHGIIDVESEINKGTSFSITFPLRSEAEGVEEDEKTTVTAAEGGHVLIVDDEDIVRDTTAESLRFLGYKVTTCRNGAEAVELYRSSWQSIDLIILDMVMPQMGGHQAFLVMQQINPEIKAIIASGYSLEEKAQEILDAGAYSFLEKPFRRNELSIAVATALKEQP
ncbi:MAG: response regulator [Planctomycetota bacterium]|jgi:PAS domain S-box-containing protein